jgi:subtilase family serine protease
MHRHIHVLCAHHTQQKGIARKIISPSKSLVGRTPRLIFPHILLNSSPILSPFNSLLCVQYKRKNEVMSAVAIDEDALMNSSNKIKADTEVVMSAVSHDEYSLINASVGLNAE